MNFTHDHDSPPCTPLLTYALQLALCNIARYCNIAQDQLCVAQCCFCSCSVSKEIGSEQIPKRMIAALGKCLDQKVTMVRQQSTGSVCQVHQLAHMRSCPLTALLSVQSLYHGYNFSANCNGITTSFDQKVGSIANPVSSCQKLIISLQVGEIVFDPTPKQPGEMHGSEGKLKHKQ